MMASLPLPLLPPLFLLTVALFAAATAAAWSTPHYPPVAPARRVRASSRTARTSTSKSTTGLPAAAATVASADGGGGASSSSSSITKKKRGEWFPIHPADALPPGSDYDAIVDSAYLRHVVVASEGMADLVMKVYLRGGTLDRDDDGEGEDGDVGGNTGGSGKKKMMMTTYDVYGGDGGDVFAKLAADVSLCPHSREGGGRIGWVSNPNNPRNVVVGSGNERTAANAAHHDAMISPDAVKRVFDGRAKGGDVVKVPSADGASWHVVRVDDLHVRPAAVVAPASSSSSPSSQGGGKNIVNRRRKKLRGSGRVPLSPSFRRIDDGDAGGGGGGIIPNRSGIDVDNLEYDDDDDQSQRTIYSVPDARYYKVLTSGCQMNVADSERIMGALEDELGLRSVDDAEDGVVDPSLVAAPTSSAPPSSSAAVARRTPDVLLLNTCTIRDHAEQKVYDALGPYAALKRAGKPLAIVVAGCVAQQEGEKLLRRFPEVDLVLGPQYVPWLSELLVEVGRGSQLCMTESTMWSEAGGNAAAAARRAGSTRDKDGEWMVPIKRGHSVRAFVNVIHGCNEHCTYCVVPGVRGVEQSRSMEAILGECLRLADAGYREVTLLGQNIDAYGRDMSPRRTFAELLTFLNDNLPDDTISRIRYVTSHPRYFSDRVIDAVANLDKVCECFHMPFQAGDDKVLKDMRRGYSHDSYMNIIRKIRSKAPDASICGDVIVGFPGETEEQFQRTLDLMDEVRFDNLNTFAYSPRPNTEAGLREDQVPEDVKADRLRRVQALAAEHALERSERYLGRVVEVLVEDRNPRNREEVMGRTRQGRQVFFPGDIDELKGEFARVNITEAGAWSLIGTSAIAV